jgi:uncharacterized membrane protein
MSEQAVSAPRLRNIPGLGRKLLIGCAIAAGLIGFAVFSALKSGGHVGAHALTVQPHLPDLALLTAAPLQVKIHLAGALTSLGIGIVLLSGVKGTGLHRALGWIWVISMGTTAVSSFWIHNLNPNGLSFIHFLSGWTVIGLPAAVFAIRQRKVAVHARAMTGMFVGGLVLAGLLSFMPGRLMWNLFF